MTTPLDRLARDYTPAFLAFLNHPDEATLLRAFELGRGALTDGVTLLDLVRIHHTVFGNVLHTTISGQDQQSLVAAAAAFLVEALAPFEMARRGFLDNSTGSNPPVAHRRSPGRDRPA